VSKLLYPATLEKLRRRLRVLPLQRRCIFWRVYRKLRRQSLKNPTETLPSVHLLHNCLQTQQLSLNEVLLVLRTATRATEQLLAACGPGTRVIRALAAEHFHLVRIELHALLTATTPSPFPSWERGEASPHLSWLAICDGSSKSRKSSAACVLYDPEHELRAEVALPLPPLNASGAELQAAIVALKTARAFGVTHLQLLTDALTTLCAFQGTLSVKYWLEKSHLQTLAQTFTHLGVRLVPRTQTRVADQLAASVSQH
jgi:ribonuclease HI